MSEHEKYIRFLKKGGKPDYSSSSSGSYESDEEEGDLHEYGQKIFFTEGGHTNK